MRPHVGAVVRHVERDVAPQVDSALFGLPAQLAPLLEELELEEALVVELVRQLAGGAFEGRWVTPGELRVPVGPAAPVVPIGERRVQHPVLEPGPLGVVLDEGAKRAFTRSPFVAREPGPGPSQPHRRLEGSGGGLGFGQPAALGQQLRRQKPRVAGEGRPARVRRAAATRRRQRQELPDREARLGGPVQEAQGCGAQVPRGVRTGERRGVTKHSCASGGQAVSSPRT